MVNADILKLKWPSSSEIYGDTNIIGQLFFWLDAMHEQ